MIGRKNKKSYGLVTVGERGQIVIPQEARNEFDIKPKDKLVIMGVGQKALILLKEDVLERFLTRHLELLGSLREMVKEEKES